MNDKTQDKAAGAPPQPTSDPKAEEVRRRADERSRNRPAEQGGPKGPEPTRYDDWERKGRCVDF